MPSEPARETAYWQSGEALYKRAIAVTTNNFIAHYCLANVLQSTKPRESLAEYQKSVEIYPDYANSQRELAIVLQSAGYYTDAIPHFEQYDD